MVDPAAYPEANVTQPEPDVSPNDGERSVPFESLAALRKERGLTGLQLGRRAGMSQAKVSKIETGRSAPTDDDVRRLARVLGVAPDVLHQVIERSFHGRQDQMTDWRVRVAGSITLGQQQIANIEATAAETRIFADALVIGLLQTTEYARSVLGILRQNRIDAGDKPRESVEEMVSSRIQRQEVLADTHRRFSFVIAEAVLQNILCSPTGMASQIERIRQVAQQENVTIAILPTSVRLPQPPVHGFVLYDELVLVDLFYTFSTSSGALDLRLYRRIFDDFAAAAVTDIDPILNRYLDFYLDMARSDRNQSQT